jgi:hypothetical protein
VLIQKKLTNFQRLLFIYNKSPKNGYYRSKKQKLFYLSENKNIFSKFRFLNFLENPWLP